MNKGKFWDSYNDAVNLLKQIDMLRENKPHRSNKYSKEGISESRSKQMNKIYQSLIDHLDYDIQLQDESLIQMNIENNESRYLYVQNPIEFVSFETFKNLNIYDLQQLMEGSEDDAYRQYLSERPINSGAVYMRYDVSKDERTENIHAYTHLHIGIDNNIRIPVGMHLTPLAFVLFVIRHVYYDKWKSLMKEKEYVKKYLNFKDGCESLPSELWSEEEKKSLYLG